MAHSKMTKNEFIEKLKEFVQDGTDYFDEWWCSEKTLRDTVVAEFLEFLEYEEDSEKSRDETTVSDESGTGQEEVQQQSEEHSQLHETNHTG